MTEKDWDEHLYVWDGQNYVEYTTVDKARQRQFSSRSEAGRYAAQIRWGNRGGTTTGQHDTRTQDQIEVEELQTMMAAQQLVMADLDKLTITTSVLSVAEWERMDKDASMHRVAMVHFDGDLAGEIVPSKKLAEAEQKNQEIGKKAIAIAERRLAERGIDKLKLMADHDAHFLAVKAVNNDLNLARLNMHAAIRRGEDTTTHRAEIKRLCEQLNSLDQNRPRGYEYVLKEEVRKLIAEVRPMGGTLNLHPQAGMRIGNPAAKALEVTVAGVVPKAIMDKVGPDINIMYGAGRGNAGSWNVHTNTINMAKGLNDREFQSTGLHEYGHAIQDRCAGVKKLDTAFLHRRIRGGEQGAGTEKSHTGAFWRQKPVSPYDRAGKDLVQRYRDSFQREYTGKTYRGLINGRNPVIPYDVFSTTEVLTTGLQDLLGKGMKGAGTDRDLLAHTVGILLTA